ncbi:hypothetical protein GE09DRAFT_1218677 [Coniochaeta sp. 2T2.1]|nr:hypothetical protein GE09DRAFT_1218677 [Coniochaeta sp. 2T2.1]
MPRNTPSPVLTPARPPPQPTHVSLLKPGPQVPDSDNLTMTSPTTSLLPSPEAEKSLFRTAYIAETTRLQAQQNVDSIFEAHSVITSILHSRILEDIWPYIRITREINISELRDIGRMRRREGIRACGRLVRVPGIHEEVAEALWEGLSVHMGMVDGEDDEQDMFERDIVMRVEKEQEELRDGTAEEKWKARAGDERKGDLVAEKGEDLSMSTPVPKGKE